MISRTVFVEQINNFHQNFPIFLRFTFNIVIEVHQLIVRNQ